MKVLDLFCGGGGAAMGINQAAGSDVEIIGVDIKKQKEYPFNFVQTDVSTLSPDFVKEFDFVWASPPCQIHSTATPKFKKRDHKCFIDRTRELILEANVPGVIENVMPAPNRRDVVLCGEMFSLRVIRHRKFEILGFSCDQPLHQKHKGLTIRKNYGINNQKNVYYQSVYGNCNSIKSWGGSKLQQLQFALAIGWITSIETITQCIPPAYSRYIFSEFLKRRELQERFF